jgi:hypothetical protein
MPLLAAQARTAALSTPVATRDAVPRVPRVPRRPLTRRAAAVQGSRPLPQGLGVLLRQRAVARSPGPSCLSDSGSGRRAPRVGPALPSDELDPEIRGWIMSPQAQDAVSMKELCLLHHRDPEHVITRTWKELFRATDQATWTDLQSVVMNRHLVEELRNRGRLDEEKYQFSQAALRFAEEPHRSRRTGVYGDIYAALWDLLQYGPPDSYFRGFFDSRWSLQSTLFRNARHIGTLQARLSMTERFLAELRPRQRELLGGPTDEPSLLAVAQHFGFPTPLLDYTRSATIAAFFATQEAASLHVDSEPVYGVINAVGPKDLSAYEGSDQFVSFLAERLLELTDTRLGKLQVITPDIPDSDNRISRQQGVFIQAFRPRDLLAASGRTVYFKQHPGVVFEDSRRGIDRNILLPESTPVAALAEKVKRDHHDPVMHPILANTELPVETLLGSTVPGFLRVINEAAHALADLVRTAQEELGQSRGQELLDVVDEYFEQSRADAQGSLGRSSGTPLIGSQSLWLSITRLATWSDTDESMLGNYALALLRGSPSSGVSGFRPPADRFPNAQSVAERLARGCVLVLAGWEHLQFVNSAEANNCFQAVRGVVHST